MSHINGSGLLIQTNHAETIAALNQKNAALGQYAEQLAEKLTARDADVAHLVNALRMLGQALKGETEIPAEAIEVLETIRAADHKNGKPWPGDA